MIKTSLRKQPIGIPRIINSVMANALLLGAQLKKRIIDTQAVLVATNNIGSRRDPGLAGNRCRFGPH